MRQTLVVFIALLGMAAAPSAGASGFKVVANHSVKASEISVDDLKRIFLVTKASLPDGSKVEPVLSKTGAAHQAFLKDLGKNDTALFTYYRSLVFTGRGSMPKVCASDAEVIEYVSKTKGAIGYVSATATTSGTKTLDVR
jgi:ABC-type phosphate transport system substrate-binding protein